MVKIFIDPGHGGSDPGATANGLKEKDLVLDISKRIKSKLKSYKGVSVRLSRTTDKTLSLSQRTNDANKWGADYLVSV
ncbi:N-acetylmuramoyl-L-alanine amidase family protein, partial [Gracilibacillus saliphilus]|uniref:N-acetylmuramoyl-L-alanine amidase family protein n=1 Tax=Gracilibacillus saliphilus TaxID=543890 RepID=UPI0013D8BE2E